MQHLLTMGIINMVITDTMVITITAITTIGMYHITVITMHIHAHIIMHTCHITVNQWLTQLICNHTLRICEVPFTVVFQKVHPVFTGNILGATVNLGTCAFLI